MEWIVEVDESKNILEAKWIKEIVRCDDCVWYKNGICKYWNTLPWYKGYCHMGERK